MKKRELEVFYNFDPSGANYKMLIEKEYTDEIRSMCAKLVDNNRLFSGSFEPYTTFELSKSRCQLIAFREIGVEEQTETDIDILVITCVLSNLGIDLLVQTQGKNTLLFPLYSFSKSWKLCFKNLFKRREKRRDKELDKIKKIEVEYSSTLNIDHIKDISISAHISKALSAELLEFFEEINKSDLFGLREYKNLCIYITKTKTNIDTNFWYELSTKNTDGDNSKKVQDLLSKIKLNFISNRLFFIDNSGSLMMNNLYFVFNDDKPREVYSSSPSGFIYSKRDNTIKSERAIIIRKKGE